MLAKERNITSTCTCAQLTHNKLAAFGVIKSGIHSILLSNGEWTHMYP